MSEVQQKTGTQRTDEATLDRHDLLSPADSNHFQAPLDLEEVTSGNLEIEEVIRRERAQRNITPVEINQTPVQHEALDPAKLVNREQERMLAQKFSALEREAAEIRAAASLEQRVEKVATKKLSIAPDREPDSAPIIQRRTPYPAINLQARQTVTTTQTFSQAEAPSAKAAEQGPIINRTSMVRPAPTVEPQTKSELTKEPQQPTPQIVRSTERQENVVQRAEPTQPERAPEPTVEVTRTIPKDQANSNLEPISEKLTARQESDHLAEDELEFEPASEIEIAPALTLEQAIKLDLSQAKIGTGTSTRQLSFRGHSLGSGTVIDRLITAIADFIKRLEMRFFSFLDRKRFERKTQKIKTVTETEAEQEGLHLESFPSSLSHARRRRRRLFSRLK